MSRQAQRQLQRQEQKPIYHLTGEQLRTTIDTKIAEVKKYYHQDIENAKKEALKYATSAVSSIILLSVRDELGLGEKRLERILNRAMKNFECVERGLVSPKDFIDELQKYGIQL